MAVAVWDVQEPFLSDGARAKLHVAEAIREAAERLGNAPTICRTCYIHPGGVDAYPDGTLFSGGAQAYAGRDRGVETPAG